MELKLGTGTGNRSPADCGLFFWYFSLRAGHGVFGKRAGAVIVSVALAGCLNYKHCEADIRVDAVRSWVGSWRVTVAVEWRVGVGMPPTRRRS